VRTCFYSKKLAIGARAAVRNVFRTPFQRSWNMDNVAQQLIDLTRVVTDAAGAAPASRSTSTCCRFQHRASDNDDPQWL